MVQKDGKAMLPLRASCWHEIVKENEIVMALKGFVSIDIIASELSDDIFASDSRGGVKGLPMSRHKLSKMAKNRILIQLTGM